MATKGVTRSNLQLLGATCLWIAAKYHEVIPPEAGDFEFLSDDAFEIDDMGASSFFQSEHIDVWTLVIPFTVRNSRIEKRFFSKGRVTKIFFE